LNNATRVEVKRERREKKKKRKKRRKKERGTSKRLRYRGDEWGEE
jgi:hypothetical protein